ncbi:extracellular solute-binding protein [Hydrogenimonas sp. SS33]|uniref:extracellular solute-binding protein n=1 Tax=Hydrogenimonas leucolamina TaxID=2954236 RepID=UPI00336C168C
MKKTFYAVIGAILVIVALLLMSRKGEKGREEGVRPSVTVYVSEDRVFSEPVLKAFEEETGIRVDAVYDTEEAKSTGVMNRLIAEKEHPKADVYWANEPIRAEILKQKGVTAPYVSPNAKGIPPRFRDPQGYWTGFSARARVLLVHRGLAPEPASILAYTDPRFKGKGVIANPLFGTTTSHIAALFTVWGDERAIAFMKAMKRNGTAISTGNGESADLVAMGAAGFSLVDSDDAVSRLRQKKPVKMLFPDQKEGELGCFIVPNTVMLIKGAPHPHLAKKLIDYLLSKKTEERLAFADCAQIPLHEGVKIPKELTPIDRLRTMKVDYARVAKKMLEIQPFLREWAGL